MLCEVSPGISLEDEIEEEIEEELEDAESPEEEELDT